ncbi:MAG: hypothetical protein GWO41_13355 [candidate division Zixibacteria bacterium]|nr:hypothetical protein [candidate division Zixibacteria bacterium]NIR63331.1 hypothetical protein [candidate division Zixibacteria bacterium]NIS17326.1 hypothetical protein [candidate division Zixibacteria bacterium]NIT53686.1 hypothetical protein [candidate division Zixibacteria bacterium]NIW42053.1 hypothetical protein [candidate division Zixibacteria bacterium]
MKQIYIYILLLLLFTCPSGRSQTESIRTISDNNYETDEIRLFLGPDEFAPTADLIFQSSTALRGRLEISSTDSDSIEIIYHKVLYANSREQAEEFAPQISLNHEVKENSLIISADAPRDAPWRKTANLSGQIECEIYLPRQFSISIDSIVGYYLSIRGPFPQAYVTGDYYDEVRVSRIDLGLTVRATNSTMILRDIEGPMLVEGEGANITARNLDTGTGIGIATFENERGAISIDGFTGDELRCISREGRITLEKLSLLNGARAFISNSGINSDIYVEVEEIRDSRLEIINKAADVQLLLPRDIQAEFNITTDPDDGEIEMSGVPLVTEQVDWGTLIASTFRHDSRIVVDTRGTGKVTVRRKDF